MRTLERNGFKLTSMSGVTSFPFEAAATRGRCLSVGPLGFEFPEDSPNNRNVSVSLVLAL